MSADYRPVPKVVAAGLGGATATILLWLIEVSTRIDVPSVVAAAVTTLLAFLFGYLRAPADTTTTPEV